jgi:hypothetical protein
MLTVMTHYPTIAIFLGALIFTAILFQFTALILFNTGFLLLA